jgi:hypothetical protein
MTALTAGSFRLEERPGRPRARQFGPAGRGRAGEKFVRPQQGRAGRAGRAGPGGASAPGRCCPALPLHLCPFAAAPARRR